MTSLAEGFRDFHKPVLFEFARDDLQSYNIWIVFNQATRQKRATLGQSWLDI